MSTKITYHQQVSYCGKPTCSRCREGIGHGPYWYAYKTENGHTTRTYIGKELPPEVKATQEELAGMQLDKLSPRVTSAAALESGSAFFRAHLLGQLRLERRAQRQWAPVTESEWRQGTLRTLFAYLLCQPGRCASKQDIVRDLWPAAGVDAWSLLDKTLAHLEHELATPLSMKGGKATARQARAQQPLVRITEDEVILAGQAQIWVDADGFEQLVDVLTSSATSEPGPEREQLLVQAATLYGGDLLPEERQAPWLLERRLRLRQAWLSLLIELTDLAIARQDSLGALKMLDRVLAVDSLNEQAVQRSIYLMARLNWRGDALRAYKRLEAELFREEGRRPSLETRELYDAVRNGREPQPVFASTHATPQVAHSVPAAPASPTASVPPVAAYASSRPPVQIGRPRQSPLVGRTSELETLYGLLDEVEQQGRQAYHSQRRATGLPLDTQRRPQCVFLMGVTGIGKTRLAEEMARQARLHGWNIAWSRVYHQESGIPYHIWTDALRKTIAEAKLFSDIFASFGTHAQLAGSSSLAAPGTQSSRLALQERTQVVTQEQKNLSRSTRGRPRRAPREMPPAPEALPTASLQLQPLVTLLPELASLVPNPRGTLMPFLSPEQEQLRLHEAVRDLLFAASESAPLLVVLDDIQWADASSGDLLGYLARHAAGRPLLFVATCRETELPETHPLRNLINHMQREHSVRTLQIEPLSSEEIARLVSHLPEDMVQRIQSQAAGNPYFAEELAHSTPPTLPSSITAALEHRVRTLSHACRQLLGSAAVLGGSFEFTTLYAMESASSSPVNEDTVIEYLEEALESGVLSEERVGVRAIYHFWHPLLVNHLYDHVSAARRARLHQRAANVLQEMYEGHEDEAAATIVRHLVAAGAPAERIVYYAQLAAEHAYALPAYAEAERHYRLALEQLDAPERPFARRDSSAVIPESEEQHNLRLSLLERLAECTMIRGHFSEARALYERVLQMRDSEQPLAPFEAQKQALLWGEVGRCWRNASDTSMARTCCERGERVLREAGITSGPAWARLRYQQGSIYRMEGRYREGRQAARESLDFFDSQQTMHLVGPIIQATRLERALAGDPVDLGNTHRLLGSLSDAEGHAEDALEHLETALIIFEQAEHKRLIAHVCCDLSYVQIKKGDFEDAQAKLRHSLNLAQSVDDAPLIGVICSNYGELYAMKNELDEAENWYRRSLAYAHSHKDKVYISQWNSRLAAVLLEEDKLAEAANCIVQAVRTARVIRNNPSLGRALVSLGNYRIAEALGMETLPTIRRRLLTHALHNLKRALALEGLEAETRVRAHLAHAHAELLLEQPDAREHLHQALHEARACDLVSLVQQSERLLV
ncbi:DUF6788 family protein [Ktedonobacter racemifer]|uniref:Transcriptional activator domain protein n=1 Tax=Ktedonobacter racemifer DSM 44963 TaxID=485913 RepID=D6TZL7_KTERA|nr:DUF6788 family protein [Ktedonobacter racemifer]EFH82007.1 transcriptional activator domain protein [Ktedonobacter racemifer DSM 44963]